MLFIFHESYLAFHINYLHIVVITDLHYYTLFDTFLYYSRILNKRVMTKGKFTFSPLLT